MKNEREYSVDSDFHAKRVLAREKAAEFKKKSKAATAVTIASAVVFGITGIFVAVMFYDRMEPVFAIVSLVATIIIICASRYVAGGIVFGSLSKFIKMSRTAAKYKSALSEMEKLEEKAITKEAFEGDIKKAEEKLSKASAEVIDIFE